MKFENYLIERTMNFELALKVFGINADDVNDKLALKKKYRDLAMQHHPDKGGDVNMAQDVNDAYGVLSKTKTSKSTVDWDAMGAKYRRWGVQIKTALLSNFNPDVYIRYFQELSGGYKFFHEITKTYPLEKNRNPHSAGFDVEFFTKDRSTVFTFKVHANLIDVMYNKSLGHGEDISYNVYTEAYGFHLNKKQKMSQRDWKHTTDHSFFRKPEQLFPKKKMKDIFSGKTSNRKFKKRDMEAFLSKKIGAKLGYGGGQTQVSIPLGEDYTMELWRTTFMKMGSWQFDGVYLKRKRVSSGHFAFGLPEEEETAKTFEKVTKEAMKVKGEAKIKKVEQLLKYAYEAWKKSKGM